MLSKITRSLKLPSVDKRIAMSAAFGIVVLGAVYTGIKMLPGNAVTNVVKKAAQISKG